jgi:hypothetical protein
MQTAKVNMTGRLHHLLARLQDVQDMRMHMALATLLLLWEALFCFFIIRKVPCASQAVLYGKSNRYCMTFIIATPSSLLECKQQWRQANESLRVWARNGHAYEDMYEDRVMTCHI